MSRFQKKLNLVHFKEKVPCPYCPELFGSNLMLCRHVLTDHNWNEDLLKDFVIIEAHGSVLLVMRKEDYEKERKFEDKKEL